MKAPTPFGAPCPCSRSPARRRSRTPTRLRLHRPPARAAPGGQLEAAPRVVDAPSRSCGTRSRPRCASPTLAEARAARGEALAANEPPTWGSQVENNSATALHRRCEDPGGRPQALHGDALATGVVDHVPDDGVFDHCPKLMYCTAPSASTLASRRGWRGRRLTRDRRVVGSGQTPRRTRDVPASTAAPQLRVTSGCAGRRRDRPRSPATAAVSFAVGHVQELVGPVGVALRARARLQTIICAAGKPCCSMLISGIVPPWPMKPAARPVRREAWSSAVPATATATARSSRWSPRRRRGRRAGRSPWRGRARCPPAAS